MVGALVVTHGEVARELVNAAHRIMGEHPDLKAVCIGPDDDIENCRTAIEESIGRCDTGDGVVLLTDMFGGTASNLSLALLDPGRIEAVTGVNLSMLLKLINTSSSGLSLENLAEAVCGRGRESIQIPSRALRTRPAGAGHGAGKDGAR